MKFRIFGIIVVIGVLFLLISLGSCGGGETGEEMMEEVG